MDAVRTRVIPILSRLGIYGDDVQGLLTDGGFLLHDFDLYSVFLERPEGIVGYYKGQRALMKPVGSTGQDLVFIPILRHLAGGNPLLPVPQNGTEWSLYLPWF
jgi:hypothetical protein